MIRGLTVGLSLATMSGMALAATSVFADNTDWTTVDSFAAGTYFITGSGTVSLATPIELSLGILSNFEVGPTGAPVSSVTYPGYAYFNPLGSDNDNGSFGPLGAGAKLGGLYGSFDKSSFFLIGSSTVQSIAAGATLYARVNDTYYVNNTGAFSVSVAAVPEPHEWAMMLAGLGLVGWAVRRRRDGQDNSRMAVS